MDADLKKRVDELDYKDEVFEILEFFGNSTPGYEHLIFGKKVIEKFPLLYQQLLEVFKSI